MKIKRLTAAELVVLVLFTVVFAMVGLEMDDTAGVLDPGGVLVSSRSMLAAWKTPWVLNEVDLTSPPLPCYLAVIPAYLHLPQPAIWLSAFAGAVILLGGFFLWRRRLWMAGSGSRRCFGVMLLLVLAHPSFLADVSSGRSTILWVAPLVAFLYFLGRFGLDMQAMTLAQESGRLSAWMESDRYQQQRLRFLWAAALCLALAGFSSIHVLFLVPPAIGLTVFLLPPSERRDYAKIVTVLLILFLPALVSQLIMAYLSWVFTGDALYFLSSTFARQLLALPPSGASFLRGGVREKLDALWGTASGLMLAWPVLFYLLARLRCWPVAALLLTPVAAQIWAEALGRPISAGAFLSVAPALTLVAFAFVLAYRPPSTAKAFAVTVVFCALTAFSWRQALSGEMEGSAQIWARFISKAAPDFEDERNLLARLPAHLKPNSILFDDAAGFAFPVLFHSASPFLVRADSQFLTALANPARSVEYIVMQFGPPEEANIDRVARHWSELPPDQRDSFERIASCGKWELWKLRDESRQVLSDSRLLGSMSMP